MKTKHKTACTPYNDADCPACNPQSYLGALNMKTKIDCGCEKDVFACRAHAHHAPQGHTPLSIDGIRKVSYGEVCTLSQGERTVSASILVSDAAFIVRAVNAHEELVDVLKEMKTVFLGQHNLGSTATKLEKDLVIQSLITYWNTRAIPAIAKAEGRS